MKNDKKHKMLSYIYGARACLMLLNTNSRKVLRGPCSYNHNNKTHQYHQYIRTEELALAAQHSAATSCRSDQDNFIL